MPIAIVCSAQ